MNLGPTVERDETALVPLGHVHEVRVHHLLMAQSTLEAVAGWFGQCWPIVMGGVGRELTSRIAAARGVTGAGVYAGFDDRRMKPNWVSAQVAHPWSASR